MTSPIIAVIDHTPAQEACDAAEAAYRRALGGGNSRATVERLRRAWVMAKARTLQPD